MILNNKFEKELIGNEGLSSGNKSNIDVNTLLECDNSILNNYEKLKEWCHNQLNCKLIKTEVLAQLSFLGFNDKYSLEKLTKLKFIELFKENPYIKYYFLRKLNFNKEGKFFTKNDITKNDINNFLELLGIKYLSDEEYKKKALDDLEKNGIKTKEQFIKFRIIGNKSLLNSLGFRYILDKRFQINDFDNIAGNKKEISEYIFSENVDNSNYVNELSIIANKLGINNFTDLLSFIYLKTDDNNIELLEYEMSKISNEAKVYLSSKGFNFSRIRGISDIKKLGALLGYLPEGLGKYEKSIISKIKEKKIFLGNNVFDIDISRNLIISEMKNNKYFNIYIHYFILKGKGFYKNFGNEIISEICDVFGITQVTNIEDVELKEKILEIKNVDDFSLLGVKEFRTKYKQNPYIREFFRRKCDLGGISKLTMVNLNKFLGFICN